ncbi:MAG: hypothetical protein H0V29_02745 [Thermoleophilaceae bacterium]|nr:hypothetical protein [Thermoleophilaceae bacterium]
MIDMHPISLPIPEEYTAGEELPYEEGHLDESAGAEVIDIQIADALFTA